MALKSVSELSELLVVRPDYRQGRPCLRGTGITVHNVAAAHMMGWTAEQLCEENPHLDPSLIYAALAYYFDNKAQVEADIDADDAEGDRLAALYPRQPESQSARFP